MRQRPYAIKKRAVLWKKFGKELALETFDITEKDLEEAVGRFSFGKHEGKLRGKIVWWVIAESGYCGENIVVRKRTPFGYRIVDYEEKIVFFGHPLDDEDNWLNDYKRHKKIHIKTEDEKNSEDEKNYYREKARESKITMIDNFFSQKITESMIRSFSSSILKHDDENVKNYLLRKLSSWCFMNNNNSLYLSIVNSKESVEDIMTTSIEGTLSYKDIL